MLLNSNYIQSRATWSKRSVILSGLFFNVDVEFAMKFVNLKLTSLSISNGVPAIRRWKREHEHERNTAGGEYGAGGYEALYREVGSSGIEPGISREARVSRISRRGPCASSSVLDLLERRPH